MSVEVHAREGDVEAHPPSGSPVGTPHPRRWRKRVAILLIVALAGFLVYEARYMPFSPANGSGGGTAPIRTLGSVVSPQGDQFDVWRTAYQNGQDFYFGFGLRNGGPLPVTVTGLRSNVAAGDGPSLVHES